MHILHFKIGDPLQWLVTGLHVTIALAAELEGEHIEAVFQQELAIGNARPAVGAKLQPEQNYAPALLGLRMQVTTVQLETVGRREMNVFRIFHGLAARDDENRLLLKDAYQ